MRKLAYFGNAGAMRMVYVALGVSLVALPLLAGCGGKKNATPAPSADCSDISTQGWSLFAGGHYIEALARFKSAEETGGGCPDAFDGHGWAQLKLDSLAQAVSDFGAALAAGATGADAMAGLATARLDQSQANPDYTGAALAADSALARSPHFVFSHDSQFDYHDLHLILAQCRYGLGDYAGANAEVDSLGGNEQDPDSPTFVQDLLAEIQRLDGIYAGQ